MKREFFLILIILLYSLSANAGDNENFVQKQKSFIRSLYEQKRYFDVIAETERLKSYSGKKDIGTLDYFICMNFYLAGQYRTVIAQCPVNANSNAESSDFLRSVSYLKLKRYSESYESLGRFDYDISNKINLNLFRRRVEPLLLDGEFEKIEAEEAAASEYLKDDLNFAGLRDELEQYREIGLKSPAGAALMSAVVPGLGQVYSGFYSDGLISLASVAVTALGGMYMHNRDDNGASYTLYFFSALFYSGNIYGAYNSAMKRNEATLGEWNNAINKKYGGYNPESYIDIRKLAE